MEDGSVLFSTTATRQSSSSPTTDFILPDLLVQFQASILPQLQKTKHLLHKPYLRSVLQLDASLVTVEEELGDIRGNVIN